MFLRLVSRGQHQPVTPDSQTSPLQHLVEKSGNPLTLRHLNSLPPALRERLYRSLIPPELLLRFHINPLTWQGPDAQHVSLYAEADRVNLLASLSTGRDDPFFEIELQDNALNGIDLNLLLLNDPHSPRYGIDYDAEQRPTQFGTLRRNLAQEQLAMQEGLAPGQVRAGLSASRQVLTQVESFLAAMAQSAYFLEPLTYASAWLFERRGFAYVRGHKLMDDIEREFQPGGALHAALDGSSPFRQPQQWQSVRGRAWAIHDGILAAIGANWDQLRMVKQIGKHAGTNTAKNTPY